MNKTKELIINSLKYYDKNREQYTRLYNRFKYFLYIKSDSDTEYNIIVFYDKNKKEIYRSRYEIIGSYYKIYNLWTWGWSHPSLKKNLSQTSRKILNYGLDIPPTDEDMYMRSELITSRFRITSDIQLDIHVALASYLSKQKMIYAIAELYDEEQTEEDGLIKILPPKNKNVQYWYIFLLDEDMAPSTLK